MHSGNDSSSLGRAVTASVVVAVTIIVVVDAMFEVSFSYLDLR
jgi:ABC-type transporter Mla maintaining outer membrane lipid asymmetry permease subunit MlaE